MDPYHDSSFAVVVNARSPNVDPQAVFARLPIVPLKQKGIFVMTPTLTWWLRADMLIIERTADTRPGLRLLRRHKPVLAGGRGAVRNSLEGVNSISGEAANFATLGLDDRPIVGCDHPAVLAISIFSGGSSNGGSRQHTCNGGCATQCRCTLQEGAAAESLISHSQISFNYRLRSPNHCLSMPELLDVKWRAFSNSS